MDLSLLKDSMCMLFLAAIGLFAYMTRMKLMQT